ncbi:hypothetical protein LPB138_13295 [Urechidicola croceus]|uniref:VWFA domain-containing protein n=2 Tax=Urechidicola croceus TaxID=1850246 RepID=A0A1D8PAH9_9FLAO|nr:hypothetical protein LPB138_13295 [Urechidicola croceus]
MNAKTGEDEKNNIVSVQVPENPNLKNAEIVFCLDATGSMKGLIDTAKEKIWDIVSELAQDNDVDTLKMGIIFYRDRGDQFITKTIPLSIDLDEVYTDLLEIQADGGGDTPESLNQALDESVNKMDWSLNKNTYKTIFVVGDCPPHMDYQDDVKYTISCQKAAENGIVINTIKLGVSCTSAIQHFKNMSNCSNGEFLQLDQDASDTIITTPYDNKINEVSKKIDESRLYYGDEKEQAYNYEKKTKSMEIYDKGSTTANSSRVSYKMSKSGKKSWMGSKEIIEDYKEGKIELKDIADDELPTALKGKTLDEKKQLLGELLSQRDSEINKLKELTNKRRKYLKEKENELRGKDSISFSKEVVNILKKQSKK